MEKGTTATDVRIGGDFFDLLRPLGFYREEILSKEPTFFALFERSEFAKNVSELKIF